MAPQLLGHGAGGAVLALAVGLLALGAMAKEQQPALLLMHVLLALLGAHLGRQTAHWGYHALPVAVRRLGCADTGWAHPRLKQEGGLELGMQHNGQLQNQSKQHSQ